MSQHTPGPWKWPGHFCTGIKVFHDDGSERGVVAHVGRYGGEFSKAEAQANARLIAAAPDLLRLLKEHLTETRRTIEDIGGCDHAVNICVCGLVSLCDTTDAIISRIESKTA